MNQLINNHTPLQSERRVLIPLQFNAPASLPTDARYLELQGLSMGTSWHVKMMATAAHDVTDLERGIQAELQLVVQQMSPWEIDSDLMRFNHAPANTWQIIPTEFYEVLQHAHFAAAQTAGAYDPTIGHLANLWGFGPQGAITQTPAPTSINQALQTTGWQKLQIDRSQTRILQTGNVHLDLCSTAKGYAVDRIARYLQAQGIQSYLVEVGGELRGLGCKPDGQPWWVELEAIAEQTDKISYIVALHGLSIATSGDTKRYFLQQGKRYSHTIDPRNGYPVQHGVAAVTVLHPECMIADALATAMMVLGPEAGMHYAKQLHAAARFVVREETGFSEYMSPAFLDMMDESLDD